MRARASIGVDMIAKLHCDSSKIWVENNLCRSDVLSSLTKDDEGDDEGVVTHLRDVTMFELSWSDPSTVKKGMGDTFAVDLGRGA